MMMRWLLLVAVLGCSASADERRVIRLSDLPGQSVGAGGTWESAPWSGTHWIDYPGRVTLEIEHGLGRVPQNVFVYLSFEDRATETADSAALAAGDLARIVRVTDRVVEIRNRTNGDYFARVVVE